MQNDWRTLQDSILSSLTLAPTRMVLPRTAWIQLNCLALVLDVFTPAYKPEVTEATFSDSGSAPVPKILNMDPGLVIFRI